MTAAASRFDRPTGVALLVAFFAVAAAICAASAFSLALPGTPLDMMWRIKPAVHDQFASIGLGAIILLKSVFFLMLAAASGLWLGRKWGWWAAMIAFSLNATGDLIHAVATHQLAEVSGVPIAALLIWYLLRPSIRRRFA